ncbi:MAG: hypothetical protein HZC28_18540 [Spirochaetes bacterium]|nr:hypothetical protein [Spirochaetota bacterium]
MNQKCYAGRALCIISLSGIMLFPKSISLTTGSDPQYSQDGKSILLSANIDDEPTIIKYSIDSHDIVRLTYGIRAYDGKFTRDGSKIYYVVESKSREYTEIWTMGSNGLGKNKIIGSTNRYRRKPVYNQCNKTIYYIYSMNKSVGIGVVDENGVNEMSFFGAGDLGINSLTVSPDCKSILYSSLVAIVSQHIQDGIKHYITPWEKERYLFSDGYSYDYINFCLSSDGKNIYLHARKKGEYTKEHFFIQSYGQKETKEIGVVESGMVYGISVSPDNKKIIFLIDDGSGYNYAWKILPLPRHKERVKLLEMNIDGTGLHEIVLDPRKIIDSVKKNQQFIR